MSGTWFRVLSKGPKSKVQDEQADAGQLADARARVHELLRPKQETPIAESKDELFAAFVRTNRDRGIDPHIGEDASDAEVGYPHRTLVPIQGDIYWEQGRTISRREIDRRFNKLAL